MIGLEALESPVGTSDRPFFSWGKKQRILLALCLMGVSLKLSPLNDSSNFLVKSHGSVSAPLNPTIVPDAGLPHVYGPAPLESLRANYDFIDLHLSHGAFSPKVELDRIGELSKDEFKALMLSNVPPRLRTSMDQYLPVAMGLAEDYQVDPFWVMAVMWVESHFNPEAESSVKAQGLMQIMPATGEFISQLLGLPIIDFDYSILRWPELNMEMGVFYLNRLIRRFDGNYRLATVAYNMGTARVLRRLAQGLPVGVNNLYLNKVRYAYEQLSTPYIEFTSSTPPAYKKTLVAQVPIMTFEEAPWEKIPVSFLDDLSKLPTSLDKKNPTLPEAEWESLLVFYRHPAESRF